MITNDRPSVFKRPAWWGGLLAVCAGVAVLLVMVRRPEVWPGQTDVLGAERETAAGSARSVAASPAGWSTPVVLPDGRPSDFAADEWAALKDAMAQTANPAAELQRVVAYLRFQKAFERWQRVRESTDLVQRQQLASRLADQVPERLRQGEVTLGEAILLTNALWADLEPDPDKRKVRLEEAQAVLAGAVPKPDAAQQAREASQLSEYKRRESAIVLEYQSRPEAQRDQAWLEAQLDAARRSVYGAN